MRSLRASALDALCRALDALPGRHAWGCWFGLSQRAALLRRLVLKLELAPHEEGCDIVALRRLGPDVGETEPTVLYVDPDLERQVMEAIARYPQSGFGSDGKVHGLAASAAITTVEKWLLERGARP